MFLETLVTGPFQANCILLGDETAGELALIDPGADGPRILERVQRSRLAPKCILHTHGHIDHAGATGEVREALGGKVPVGLHPDELEWYLNLPKQARFFGLTASTPPEPDFWLDHGSEVRVGTLVLEVRHTPGHSPGSVTFVVHGAGEPLAVVGDTLFAGSIGRTDLPGGSLEVLDRSIREQLYTLEDGTRVVCGHGPDTTIGREKATNPFVRVER